MKKKVALPLLVLGAGFMLMACGKNNGGKKITPVPVDPVTGGVSGVTSFVTADYTKREEILGILEKHAVDNGIAGIPFMDDGGLVMYNDRVVKGTNTYVKGYGFGTGRYGSLSRDLDDPDIVKPSYYQSFLSEDPGDINYLDDDGSVKANLYGNCQSAYFGTELNEAKDNYRWHGLLSSKDRPVAIVNGEKAASNAGVRTRTWRVYLRTGEAGGVAFRSGSSKADRKAFDGRWVTIDDYVTAFKVLACGEFAYYRGNELVGQTGSAAIEGLANYYNVSATYGWQSEEAEAAFAEAGIKKGHDADGDYIDFTLGAVANEFYAMYNLSATLYSPINLEFFNLVTGNGEEPSAYAANATDLSSSTIDNVLSVGPWYLESYEPNIGISFARNDNWYERVNDKSLFNIPGYYYRVFTKAKSDSAAVFEELLAGRADGAGIPAKYVAQYKNDPRTTTTPGSTVWKLNINSCTEELWDKLFGPEGTITQTPSSDAWNVKPWMSNELFIRAINMSIDRKTFAESVGANPSIDYFGDEYEINPEDHVFYNDTETHKAAIADFWGSTVETYGYSVSLAQQLFGEAIDELIASGDVHDGDDLTIDSWWQAQSDQDEYGEPLARYIEDAFNTSPKAEEHNLTLDVTLNHGANWYDVYYDHLMVGQFDLGFGSISGNTLDPLNFMEVLKSDNSSGFTLNWGADTSALNLDFDSDGDGTTEKWSFDTLWAAADHGVATKSGVEIPPLYLNRKEESSWDDEGNLVISYTYASGKEKMRQLAAEGDVQAQNVLKTGDDGYFTEATELYYQLYTSYVLIDEIGEDGNWMGYSAYDEEDPNPYVYAVITAEEGKAAQAGEVELHITPTGIEYTNYYGAYGYAFFGLNYHQEIFSTPTYSYAEEALADLPTEPEVGDPISAE